MTKCTVPISKQYATGTFFAACDPAATTNEVICMPSPATSDVGSQRENDFLKCRVYVQLCRCASGAASFGAKLEMFKTR